VKVRDYGKNLYIEPAWWCGRCNYWKTCKPDMSKHKVGTRERDKGGQWKPWEMNKKALDYQDLMEGFVNYTLENL
jgi:hypothetical protein